MLSAVLSDLHLGMRSGADLLRLPAVRARVFERLADADRVVLLGDFVELRDRPLEESLALGLPFFSALGEALAGRPLTFVPGNHDHRLVEDALRRDGAPRLEQRFEVRPGDALEPLAHCLGDSTVELAYPGVWLNAETYATHGHYLDCHSAARTFECRARAAVERVRRLPRDGYRAPPDYERALAPIYRLIHLSVQPRVVLGAALGAKALIRRWERPHSNRGARAEVGIAAMREVVRNLDIGAQHVVFGHLHVPGRWQGSPATELVNAGSWVADSGSVAPGTCVFVGDEGPPRLESLI